MLHQGVHLLERFVRDDRIHIRAPRQDLQVKMVRNLSGEHEFVAYLDAIGELDGQRCVIDWKTTTSRYPEDPNGLLSLDPQLVCYSWITGIPEVALVVFVRKHLPEIQYLKTTISEKQRREFGRLIETTVPQIDSGEFPAHSSIRFGDDSELNLITLCAACHRLAHRGR